MPIFRVVAAGMRGCNDITEIGDDAATAARMYYKNGITALFGPMCHSSMKFYKNKIMVLNLSSFSARFEKLVKIVRLKPFQNLEESPKSLS